MRPVLLISFFACIVLRAQPKNDSLLKLLPSAQGAKRAEILNALSKNNWNANPAEALSYASEAVKIADSLNDIRLRYDAYYNSGVSVFFLSDLPSSLNWFLKAEALAEKENNPDHIASSLNSIGNVYQQLEDYPRALDYFKRSLKLREETGDSLDIASTLANMGGVYDYMLKEAEALSCFRRALALWNRFGYTEGVANCYIGMGSIQSSFKNYDSAVFYYSKAAEIKEKGNDRVNLAGVYHNIGDVYSFAGDYAKAKAYLLRSLAISEELGVKTLLRDSYYSLAVCYEKLGDEKRSLEYLRKNSAMKDSVFNEENTRSVNEMAIRFDTEKKQNQILMLQKDSELQAVKLKKNNTLLLVLASCFVLFILVIIMLSGRNRAKKKANRELNFQNALLSQQEKEITDSIHYAHSIQQSMLPAHDVIAESLADHFILNRPKDIVSGDFYFFERADDRVIFSAVDCTGHGVPGALLSFLGMDILREAVKKQQLTRPADILSYLDSEVYQRLRQSADQWSVNDGMDLALCTLHLKTNELQFAGAFNPLYIISEGKFTEIKPDKYAVGSGVKKQNSSYINHSLQLKKGDCIYMFSDGYADQFGGPDGKKFKYKMLQRLLMENCQFPMKEQKQALETAHLQWKGDFFQVDDVLVMGIRIA